MGLTDMTGLPEVFLRIVLAISLGHTVTTHEPKPTLTESPSPSVAGRASWYHWRPGEAAAGPALRALLGPNWRGRTVLVSQRTCNGTSCSTTTSKVRLTDWCQCYRGEARERLVDLDRRTFALFASPSRGLVRITIRVPPD